MTNSFQIVLPSGATPRSVIAQLPLWYGYMFVLCVLVVIHLVTLSIIETIIGAVMTTLAWLLLRNRMKDAPKFVFVYAVLCVVNFFFDAVPLFASLRGRASIVVDPGYTFSADGVEQTTFTRTTRITPFFDMDQGVKYNVDSGAMIACPLCMLVGACLSIRAHFDIRQAVQNSSEVEEETASLSQQLQRGTSGTFGGQATPSGRSSSRSTSRQDLESFPGKSYKLVN